jgi:hypothetical protein
MQGAAGKLYLQVIWNEYRAVTNQFVVHELGISIPPSQVRLSPDLKDPYRWVIRDDQKKLFEPIFVKNLSSHSINTYRLLSNGVKREAFRAVPIDANSDNNVRRPISKAGLY